MNDKKHVVEILEEMALLLELKGENPFKVRAYNNASRTLQGISDDITTRAREGGLTSIKGIGKTIAEVIKEVVTTGISTDLEALRASIPRDMIEMLKIPGLGPKKVHALWEKLGVATVRELEYACIENRLIGLEGFGRKTQENILRGIAMLKKFSERHLLSEAKEEAENIYAHVKEFSGIIRCEIAGSIRRWKETVKDIDMLVSAVESDRENIMDMFIRLPQAEMTLAKGSTKSSIRLKSGINADLRIVTDEQFPYALHHFTGSKEHNVAMRGHAKKMDLKMNEYGLFKNESMNIQCQTEADIFDHLGMQYIHPELRENYGEIEAAQKREIPALIEWKDIRGLIHVHSHYSDGVNSIGEMAEAARTMGYEYMIVCDHSKKASYANGLNEERILQQHKEIEGLNRKLKDFKIFKGIECDILADGSLDYTDEVLALFDVVIASIHYKFTMTENEATQRMIRAMHNPYVTMLGHPTGRLLLAREGYPIDMLRIIQTSSELGVALELNANPHRLDIDWRLLRDAKKQGVKISINPDAHRIEGIKDIRYGVGIARKGWLSKEDVLNCFGADDLILFTKKRREMLA
ncbi:MAG: DNA polymerase/3'-5' exonuclease PolX [bacterium]